MEIVLVYAVIATVVVIVIARAFRKQRNKTRCWVCGEPYPNHKESCTLFWGP